MNQEKTGGRQLKAQVLSLLKADDFHASLSEIVAMPARRVINPILSFFCHNDENVRFRAVTAAGEVVGRLAEAEREAARVIMRRLMWTLNEESGGIGWGAPEAMAEIMVRDRSLAEEYAPMLISYMNRDGNFLEHEMLQRGLLWGVTRLAEARPSLLENAVEYLGFYLGSRDGAVRGLAARAAGLLGADRLRSELERLQHDETRLSIYEDDRLKSVSVGDMAREALIRLALKNRSLREEG